MTIRQQFTIFGFTEYVYKNVSMCLFLQGHQPPIDIIVDDFLSRVPCESKRLVLGDAYYGSVKAMNHVIERGHYGLFSCMSNRPSYLFAANANRKLEKRQYDWLHDESILALRWQSKKKCVNFLSNVLSTPAV